MLFSRDERVYDPQNAPLSWWWCITITLACFEGHRPSPTTPKFCNDMLDWFGAIPWASGYAFSWDKRVCGPQTAPCYGNDASPWYWSVLRAVDPLHPPPNYAPTSWINRGQSPGQAYMLFSGDSRVIIPLNAPMLWWCIITIALEHFEGHRTSPATLQSHVCLLGGLLAINPPKSFYCGLLGGRFCWRLPWLCLFSVGGLVKLELVKANCQMPYLFHWIFRWIMDGG